MIDKLHIKRIKNNLYDYFLTLLVCLLIFGMYGDSLQPVRVVSLASLPFIIVNYVQNKEIKILRRTYLLLLGLYLYLLLSLLWTSDLSQGAKEAIYYLAHFSLLILILLLYFKANNPLRSLTRGWFIFIALTLIIALYEISTGKHLSVDLLPENFQVYVNGVGVDKKYASVTFGNYNTYVMVISMALPFLFGFLYLYKRFHLQLLTIIVITLSYLMLFINASRGGLMAGAIILLIWLFYVQRHKVHHLKAKLIFLVPLALYGVFYQINLILEQITNRAASGGSITQDEGRMDLMKSALAAFWRHPFFGSGIGSIQTEMQDAYITLPHNLFLEFLVQYGIVVTFIISIILFNAFRKTLHLNSFAKVIMASIFFAFPIITVINSSYLLHPVLWVFLASIFCVSFQKSLTPENA